MGLLGKAMAFRAGKAIFDQATRSRRGATRPATGATRTSAARSGARPATGTRGGGGLAGIARRFLRG